MQLEALVAALLGTILVLVVNHERRLTRVEAKIDLLLRLHGANPGPDPGRGERRPRGEEVSE